MESLNNNVEHVCNKKAFCTHDKRKSTCKECGGRGLCKVPLCETIGNPRYKGQCVCCFIHLFSDEKNVHNYKAKESKRVSKVRIALLKARKRRHETT